MDTSIISIFARKVKLQISKIYKVKKVSIMEICHLRYHIVSILNSGNLLYRNDQMNSFTSFKAFFKHWTGGEEGQCVKNEVFQLLWPGAKCTEPS